MSNANRLRLRVAAAAVASGALAVGGFALAATAGASNAGHPDVSSFSSDASHPAAYTFSTLDNANDPTFNQLLGINDNGHIAGYFGSGAAGHPNKGYLLRPPYGSQAQYQNINFPGSVQTQLTGLNDEGVQVGFWSDMNNANQVNDNFGFYLKDGRFHTVNDPNTNGTPPVNQLLGVNNDDIAVGFYTDAQGNNHGYTFDIRNGRFGPVTVPGNPGLSLTAAAINDRRDIAGFYTDANGITHAFLRDRDGQFRTLDFPGASATQALGVNDRDEVVGVYTVGSGNSAMMHGFTWTQDQGFTTVDDPNGVGTTTVNGVDGRGDLVGFYVDGNGNTDGMLATPARRTTVRLDLSPMPAGTVTTGEGQVTVSAFGLTPGSSHAVELAGRGGLTQLGTLTANGVGQADVTFPLGSVSHDSRLVILDGAVGTSPIARTSRLDDGDSTHPLHAVEAGADEPISGRATVTYDPNAQTITVTVTATGLTPGMHAAHIHVGSCQAQGPVRYMLMDFVADGHGTIDHETRTVTGVTTPMPATGWYLNLHQGNSNNILANGQPTIFFRPLLCANI
jgi:Cu/Zn superoxide dismutase